MADRTRIPLVMGGALDRESGGFAVQEGSFENLRNVVLYQGKARVRYGSSRTSQLPPVDPGTGVSSPIVRIPAFSALRSAGIVMATTAHADRTSHLHQLSGQGVWQTYAGRLSSSEDPMVLPEGATWPPRFHMAESYHRMFIAHDEGDYASADGNTIYRKPTYVYYAADKSLTPLMADFTGTADTPVRFRGVSTYLNYLVGWGYGSRTEPNRPEMVRISKPGLPTSFDAEHYFIVGSWGDPVLTVSPAGSVLLVFKAGETYAIVGTNRDDFGVLPVDHSFGCLTSRLAVTVGGVCFFWSSEGPRMSEGGPSTDLAIPLDLGGIPPKELAGLVQGSRTHEAEAHACYLPVDRSVLFMFPDYDRQKTLVYCLSIRDTPWKWSYFEIALDASASRLLYPGVKGSVPPYPPLTNPHSLRLTAFERKTVPDVPSTTITTARLHWENPSSYYGDEVVEIYVKKAGGSWERGNPAESANDAGGPGRQITIAAGTDYEVAIRYRKGGDYHPDTPGKFGDEGFDPSTWPASVRASFTTLYPSMTATYHPDTRIATLTITSHGERHVQIYKSENSGPYELSHSVTTDPSGTTVVEWYVPETFPARYYYFYCHYSQKPWMDVGIIHDTRAGGFSSGGGLG